jgi:hypothetical protein
MVSHSLVDKEMLIMFVVTYGYPRKNERSNNFGNIDECCKIYELLNIFTFRMWMHIRLLHKTGNVVRTYEL